MVQLILCAHLETVLIVYIFFAAALDICMKHPNFRVHSFYASTSIFEALSTVMAKTLGSIRINLKAKHVNTYKDFDSS